MTINEDQAREQYEAFMAGFEIGAAGSTLRVLVAPATDVDRARAAGLETGQMAHRSAGDAARRRYGWAP